MLGVIAKFILNIILVPIPELGVKGAAIGSEVCHIISCIIIYIKLKKHIKLKLNFTNCIIKPVMATIMMMAIMQFGYTRIIKVCSQNISTLISIIIGLILYIILIFLLRIFRKSEIILIPK